MNHVLLCRLNETPLWNPPAEFHLIDKEEHGSLKHLKVIPDLDSVPIHQLVYVAVNTDIYIKSKQMRLPLTNTLCIRNISVDYPIIINHVEYYDADGITSTVLLVEILSSLGARVNPHIPSRQDDGYGLNLNMIDEINNQQTKLIITVDNGISALDAIKKSTVYCCIPYWLRTFLVCHRCLEILLAQCTVIGLF